MPFVASFGGDYMNRETGLCTGTLDGDNTIASFDFLAKLFTDGYAMQPVIMKILSRRVRMPWRCMDIPSIRIIRLHLAMI